MTLLMSPVRVSHAEYQRNPNATIDGGEGTDTLRVTSDTNWSNLSITNVEVLDGQGGRTDLTPQDLLDRGFYHSKQHYVSGRPQ